MDSRLVLASASPARLRVLRHAGFDPEVVVSGAAEVASKGSTEATVRELARVKAHAVAARRPDAIVIGCDSMLEVDGVPRGKPASPEAAMQLWRVLRGSERSLYTGHCVVDAASMRTADAVCRTTVRFGDFDEGELQAYLATGEPMQSAGGFTIDGRGAPFVEGVDGDPNNVLGLSISLLRRLLAELGIRIVDLWSSP